MNDVRRRQMMEEERRERAKDTTDGKKAIGREMAIGAEWLIGEAKGAMAAPSLES